MLIYVCLFAVMLFGLSWIVQIILRQEFLRRRRREQFLRFRWDWMFDERPDPVEPAADDDAGSRPDGDS